MKRIFDLTDVEIDSFLKEFYAYFDTGYEFEEFLKIYLEKIGLDEVSVTQRSRDGGIDLKAIRKGVGDFSDADSVEYYVQAKRNKPGSTVPVAKVRELKGTIPFGHKGIFITTAKFSRDAAAEAGNDISKPVILIDGKALISSCIDNELGFVFKPAFSKQALDMLKEANQSNEDHLPVVEATSEDSIVVERQITLNDIRVRMLIIPRDIIHRIPPDAKQIKVRFEDMPEKALKIDKHRRFLSGVTEYYKRYNLIEEDGSYTSKRAVWRYSDGRIQIKLKENN